MFHHSYDDIKIGCVRRRLEVIKTSMYEHFSFEKITATLVKHFDVYVYVCALVSNDERHHHTASLSYF